MRRRDWSPAFNAPGPGLARATHWQAILQLHLEQKIDFCLRAAHWLVRAPKLVYYCNLIVVLITNQIGKFHLTKNPVD
jgi:hypothetical protein